MVVEIPKRLRRADDDSTLRSRNPRVEPPHTLQDRSPNMYNLSGASDKEDVAPNEDETETPNSPSDRLLMWSASTLAPRIETGRPASRAHVLLLRAMGMKAPPNHSSSNTTRPVVIPKSPSPMLQTSSIVFGEDSEVATTDKTLEYEGYRARRTKRHKLDRDAYSSTCQNVPFPATGSHLACIRSAIRGGLIDTTTGTPERVSTIDMGTEPALETSIGSFTSVILTPHVPDDALTSSLMTRPRFADEADDEEAGNDFLQHKNPLMEAVNKSGMSDMEALTMSADSLYHNSSDSISRRENCSIDRNVDLGQSMTMNKPHQRASSSDNHSTVKKFLADNERPQNHDAAQVYLTSLDRDEDPSVLENDRSSETTEKLEDGVEAEPECYRVVRNGHKNHYIVRRQNNVPQWNCLTSLPDMSYRGVKCKVGDVVCILLQDNAEDSYAKICEIRDLGDGRKVISILWYFTIKDARSCGCTTLNKWPKGKTHMLTNMLQVLMWDTINGMADMSVLNRLESRKILDVCRKSCTILERNSKIVDWINHLL